MTDIESLEKEIEEFKAEKERLEDNDNIEEYDEFLDDVYGEIDVCGIKYCASHLLKEVDPTAYRCGMNDFNDNKISEIEGRIEEIEDEINELKQKVKK
jgi:DNA repair exonuclease SbcCD ATPase subunit